MGSISPIQRSNTLPPLETNDRRMSTPAEVNVTAKTVCAKRAAHSAYSTETARRSLAVHPTRSQLYI